MKLSLVFELLLIFVLLAFAASKSVKNRHNKKGLQKATDTDVDKIEDNSINKYCKCVEAYCNCCRDFAVPLVNLNGPGCAKLTYLNGDKMSVSLSFGKKVITNRTLSSKKPSPVCMPLPGGVSKFCGRVYNIARAGEDFRACLGLELQSKSAVEAAVRVSCFKFGAKGVTSEPADPLPLIPDEKDDEDDDDDDDDDYALDEEDEDDDDDDDEEESELDAVNDVESADYTGFSLLGEDLLGDLFGSSGSKKTNKNKKKQAPVVSTTTTKRPRPTRRPARRPSTRTTTPRTTRSTTVKIRPVNRRPTRRPTRRPHPTTAPVQEISTPIITTTSSTAATPVMIPVTSKIHSENENQITSVSDETFEPIIGNRPQFTTVKTVTNFEDPGLQMSLAHITGQLSSMPVIPLNTEDAQGSSKVEKLTSYERIETITPKAPSTSDDNASDDMIQIVQTLDSAEETMPNKEAMTPDESRGYKQYGGIRGVAYEGLSLPKRKESDNFQLEDLDILDLSNIGETIGDQLGIFGGKKRQNRHTEEKEPDYSDYHEVVHTMGDALLLARNNNGGKIRKDRRRQNKMMRGEWSNA